MCARKSDDSVWCWGYNGNGQVGDGTSSTHMLPVQVHDSAGTGYLQATQLGLGGNHSCAVLSDTTVSCWGSNGIGELGIGSTTDQPLPSAIPAFSGVTRIVGGGLYQSNTADYSYSCALESDGSAWCWGSSNLGELGNGSFTVNSSSPFRVVP
jgi:alpha-tubulin suppressor-like RCC1 family protein